MFRENTNHQQTFFDSTDTITPESKKDWINHGRQCFTNMSSARLMKNLLLLFIVTLAHQISR